MQKQKAGQKDVCLVHVPGGLIYTPSLALGILKSAGEREGLTTGVLYADMVMAGEIGWNRYNFLNNLNSCGIQFMEVVFAPYAGYKEYSSLDEIGLFLKDKDEKISAVFPQIKSVIENLWLEMDRLLDVIADSILEYNPKAVGCSYGFQGGNACFAILKRIKEKNFDIVTFMGGSSCSEYSGQAIADYIDSVDYVFCGESDDIFADAVRLMISGNKKELRRKYPAVAFEGARAKVHATADMNAVPLPDYDDYFEQLDKYGLRDNVDIIISYESSRGCWWGCLHKCRFCGFGACPEMIRYRKKDADKVISELDALYEKYHINSFFFCDCILDYEFSMKMKDMLEGRNYSIFAEVKSNMGKREVLKLREAGFRWFQPGIEAIQDDLLTYMNKGNRAIKQIEFLKWCTAYKIVPYWNLITDFPGEKNEWYQETINRIPYITHLYPPNLVRLMYQPGSYYMQHADEYGVKLHIEDFYYYQFAKDRDFIEHFAEYYAAETHDIPYYEELNKEVLSWQKSFSESRALTYRKEQNGICINDYRTSEASHSYKLIGLDAKICAFAEETQRLERLHEIFGEYSGEEIEESLKLLTDEYKIVLRVRDEILFLAIDEELIHSFKKEPRHGYVRRQTDSI